MHDERLVYLHRGDSRYDEFFVNYLSDFLDVRYLTLNPHPSIQLDKAEIHSFKTSIDSLYKYTKLRSIIYLVGLRNVKRYVKESKPDIMIGCYASTYGFLAAMTGFHPFVLFVFGNDVLVDPGNIFFSRIVKFTLSRADLVIVDSQVQEQATINLGVDPRRILRFPRVDPQSISKVDHSGTTSIRNALGWGKNKIIVHSRWHEPVYDVGTAIRAFALVVKARPDARLLLIGGGPETEKLRKLVKSLDISNYVYFAEKMPWKDLIAAYDDSDVYISTSLSDGTSASLIEAMIRGIPAVVSDIPGNREWIVNKENGLLFPCRSFSQLSDKIIELLNNPSQGSIYAEKARATVFDKANWHANRDILLKRILALT